MVTNANRLMAILLAFALLLGTAPRARAAAPSSGNDAGAVGRTPPRLSYIAGEVSFWRPGAQDWAPAQVNTPLAPGDELYAGNQGDLELQVGARGFVRARADTQLGLANQEPDFLQLKVTSGHVSLDLRSLDPGRTVELDTPHAAFTIEHPGYYRADVTPERTAFITRRAGRATLTPAGGQAVAIAPSEEVVLEGTPTPTVRSYAAPELDAMDQWNYARSDTLLAVSARYVSSDVYGVDDLDHYGNWRVVQTYGPVWVPQAVPSGWVPYGTGRWIWDPYYGWTWIDTAPWGWAPYHYGRWVFVDGFWAWAPGPVVVRPVYAPALVAFFGAPGIGVSVGTPLVSWVALSWGEPIVPWWGPPAFVGTTWWGGWGGPRVVNNVVVNQTTVINVKNITVYRNVNVQNAIVAVRQDHFGVGSVREARIREMDIHRLEPVHGSPRATPDASSFVAANGRAAHPPEAVLTRPVVATRPPAGRPPKARGEAPGTAPVNSAPAPQIGSTPGTDQPAPGPPRPRFGTGQVERQRPPLPPRVGAQPPEATLAAPRDITRNPEAVRPAPHETPAARERRGPGELGSPPRTLGRPAVAPPPPQRPESGNGPDAVLPDPRQAVPPVEHRGAGDSVRPPRIPSRPSPAATQRFERPGRSMRPVPGEASNRLAPGRTEIRVHRPGAGPGVRPHPGRAPFPERDQR